MTYWIIQIIKAVLLTEAVASAMTRWDIFTPVRQIVRRIRFFDKLLACFECSSVWAAAFVLCYLVFFEVTYLTYLLIIARLAWFVRTLYDWVDASRAVKEGEI